MKNDPGDYAPREAQPTPPLSRRKFLAASGAGVAAAAWQRTLKFFRETLDQK